MNKKALLGSTMLAGILLGATAPEVASAQTIFNPFNVFNNRTAAISRVNHSQEYSGFAKLPTLKNKQQVQSEAANILRHVSNASATASKASSAASRAASIASSYEAMISSAVAKAESLASAASSAKAKHTSSATSQASSLAKQASSAASSASALSSTASSAASSASSAASTASSASSVASLSATSLTSSQESTLLAASPIDYAENQIYGVSLTEQAVNYDNYDYNILSAFANHSTSTLNSGFVGVVENSDGTYSYSEASYTPEELTAASTLMSGFAAALSGATTQQQEVQDVVQYVADHVTYSTTGEATDEQQGDLSNRNIYEGNLNGGYISDPVTDYGEALAAAYNGSGVCEQYAELEQLGLLYAGVTSTAADNANQTLQDLATNGGTNYMHMWNYVLINGQWYQSDSTWYDSGVTGSGNQQWVAMGSVGESQYDDVISSISYGSDPVLTNFAIHTPTANSETLADTTYLN